MTSTQVQSLHFCECMITVRAREQHVFQALFMVSNNSTWLAQLCVNPLAVPCRLR